jgi:hypothetical protein
MNIFSRLLEIGVSWSNRVSSASSDKSKPWWWKPMWMAILVSIVASALVGIFLLYIPLERVVYGLVFGFLCVGGAYYIRIRPSITVNRVIYIVGGACWTFLAVFFGGAFIIRATGLPSPITHFSTFFIIFFIAPLIIGAFIGDWIGKRANYSLPLSFNNP